MPANHGYALDPGIKGLLASLGVRYQDVLRRAGLPEDLLNGTDVRLQRGPYFALARALYDAADDPLFPIRMVDALSAEWFSPPVFAALCSPNLTVAATRLARFKPLVAPMELGVHLDPDVLRLTVTLLDSPVEPPPLLAGTEALGLVKLARMGTRRPITPVQVTMPHIPPSAEAYEAFLSCPITEGPQLTVCFTAEDAQEPFLTNNSAMWDIFEPQLRQRLADLEGGASFENRTRAVLIEALPSGQVSVDWVAQRLAVSARTLQRRLREEGTSFKGVVNDVRESLARHYLGQTQLSASEIAYLLGFEETASFFRAFQRWTGTTPEALRQSLRSDESPPAS